MTTWMGGEAAQRRLDQRADHLRRGAGRDVEYEPAEPGPVIGAGGGDRKVGQSHAALVC
jgi:hypothetical protein